MWLASKEELTEKKVQEVETLLEALQKQLSAVESNFRINPFRSTLFAHVVCRNSDTWQPANATRERETATVIWRAPTFLCTAIHAERKS